MAQRKSSNKGNNRSKNSRQSSSRGRGKSGNNRRSNRGRQQDESQGME